MTNMDINPVILPKYKDGTYNDAVGNGYDLVQLKYDGWNARVEIHYGWVTWYSKTGRKYHQICYPDAELHAVIYAEHMFGTQWAQHPEREGTTFCFDLWALNGQHLEKFQYRERISLLRSINNRLPSKFQLVQSYPIQARDELWKTKVETGEFEGIVYKRRTDPIQTTLIREKHTFTEDVKVKGMTEGEGKFKGMMGSLQCETKEGVPTDVGGGFSDEERVQIFHNFDKYKDKWLEAEARAKFDSGALRHANFIRWRYDLT